MPDSVSRGSPITRDAFYRVSGVLTDPVNPKVSVIDANGVTLVNLATPTQVGTGHYQYTYTFGLSAPLGASAYVWYGELGGEEVGPITDGFTLVEAGSIGVGSAAAGGPCEDWCDALDLCSPCDDYDFDQGLIGDAIEAASGILFEMSGRRFPGVCEATVRPCVRRAADEYRGVVAGTYRVICGCQRGRRCGCGSLSEITLGGYPLVAISEVKVDGVVLNPSLYRIDDHRRLVRLPDADGTNPGWPCCQRLDLASTEEETFEVTFTYGRTPPAAGRRAAAKLACEMALACSPETAGKCQLSQRVQSVTRQGVTVVMDRLDALKDDLTGIPEVDLFLKAYNPAGLRRRAQVISPDIGRRVRRAGT